MPRQGPWVLGTLRAVRWGHGPSQTKEWEEQGQQHPTIKEWPRTHIGDKMEDSVVNPAQQSFIANHEITTKLEGCGSNRGGRSWVG